jgi:peptidyl-prolyl cis-trans isomerase B (cyclophilin B)
VASCSRNEIDKYALTDREGYETVARLETTQGEITIRFHPDKAPAHVTNFVNLCGMGFYDGTYFHRVAPEFLIQGGDPNTKDEDLSNDGLGGHAYAGPQTTLRTESQDTTCFRGAIAMARTEDVDSAGSQFFIMLAEASHLDGQYTVFGEVIEGIEVADQIAEEPGEPVEELGGFYPAKHQYIESCTLEERPRSTTKAQGNKVVSAD